MPQDDRLTLKKMTFSKSLRGYSCDEVDTYIDYVTDKYAQVCREYTEVRRRLTTTAARESELRAEDAEAQKSRMEKCQKSCDAMVDEAKRHAARILAEAEHEAKLIIRQAEDEAQNIAANAAKEGIRAQYEANRAIAAKSNLADRMVQEIDTFRKEVFALYADHIDALEHLGKMTDDFYQQKNELADAGEAAAPAVPVRIEAEKEPEEETLPEEISAEEEVEETAAWENALPDAEPEEETVEEIFEETAEEPSESFADEPMEEPVEEEFEEPFEEAEEEPIDEEFLLTVFPEEAEEELPVEEEEEFEVWSGQAYEDEESDGFEEFEESDVFEAYDEPAEPEVMEDPVDPEEIWEEEAVFSEGELSDILPEPEQWDSVPAGEEAWASEEAPVEFPAEEGTDAADPEDEFTDTAELLRTLFGNANWEGVPDTARNDEDLFEEDTAEPDKTYEDEFDADENDLLLADLKSFYGAEDDEETEEEDEEESDFEDDNAAVSFVPVRRKAVRHPKDMDDLFMSGDATNSTKDISLTGEFDIIFSKEKSIRNVEEIGKQPMVAPEAPTKPKKHSKF